MDNVIRPGHILIPYLILALKATSSIVVWIHLIDMNHLSNLNQAHAYQTLIGYSL